MFKRLFLTSLLLIPFYFLLITPPAHAQGTDLLWDTYCQRRQGNQLNLETWYGGRCLDEKITKDNIDQTIGFGDIIILDLYGKIANKEGSGMEEIARSFLGSKNTLEQIQALASTPNSGAIIDVSRLISMLYANPPASSIEYVAGIIDNFQNKKLAQPVYAQNTGFGFSALSPVLPVWRIFRNLAYLVFILNMIIKP